MLLLGVSDMHENILGRENIFKLFIKYSIPTIAGMLFLGLNTVVDGFFVGNYIGAAALATVNIAMPFTSIMLAAGVVIGIGAQSVIGRKLGEGKPGEAADAFRTALILIGTLSVGMSAAALGFSGRIAGLLGANEHLMPLAASYIYYLGLFLPFLGIMFVLDYVLKVMARPVYAMLALIVAVASHMLLNYLLIVRLGMGVKGAALATGLGYTIACVMAVLPFLTGKTSLKIGVGRFDKKLAGNIIYNGSSEGLTEMGNGITTFLFNITLMRYVGEMGVAAFTAVSYLSFISNNILIGLSDGVGAIISYNYGSGRLDRVKTALKLAASSALLIGVIIFILISLYNRQMIGLFLDAGSGEVLDFAAFGARLYAFAFLVNGLNIVISGYFTAIGKPKSAALIAVSKGIIWVAAGVAVLPGLLGIQGIWLTVPIAEGITIMLSAFMVYTHFKPKPTGRTK